MTEGRGPSAPRGLRRAALAGAVVVGLTPAGAVETAEAASTAGVAAPWSFHATPTDQLAVPGEAAGAEITPEGSLYTGYGELGFRVGPRGTPYVQRRRALVGGHYPIVRGGVTVAGVRYQTEAFAARSRSGAAFFLRVTLFNPGPRRAAARFAFGWRWSGGRLRNGVYGSRFERPVTDRAPGLYLQPGAPFAATASFSFQGGALVRDGRVLAALPAAPPGVRRVLRVRAPGAGPAAPGTVVAEAAYSTRLAPGQRTTLDVVVPARPPVAGSSVAVGVAHEAVSAARARTLKSWKGLLGRATRVALPEPLVADTYAASIVNDAMVRYRVADEWNQPVNKLQYHAFWLRDASLITRMYDVVGLFDLARENLRYFLRWQRDDGLFISRPGQYDGFGQALWGFGEHVRRARDTAFAREVLPAVRSAMAWFARQRADDALGLMPSTTVSDDEATTGRLAGDAFWAQAGVAHAVVIARAAGSPQLAEAWARELAAYRGVLDRAVREAAARTAGGGVPPALDREGGLDFGNLSIFYPTEAYAATSPLVAATIERARRRFREGLATYDLPGAGRLLHASLGFRVWETDLARGDQRSVVQGLYDSLVHTTPTRGGFELANGRRVNDNMTPNGWWAAEYVTLLREMLVREQGENVVLMSALAPAWLRGTRSVQVRGARTLRGPISFTLRPRPGGARLTWRSRVTPGTRLRWPVPAWVTRVRSAALSGDGHELVLHGRSGTLNVAWRLRATRHEPSYAASLARLRRNYAGAPAPAPDSPLVPGT